MEPGRLQNDVPRARGSCDLIRIIKQYGRGRVRSDDSYLTVMNSLSSFYKNDILDLMQSSQKDSF